MRTRVVGTVVRAAACSLSRASSLAFQLWRISARRDLLDASAVLMMSARRDRRLKRKVLQAWRRDASLCKQTRVLAATKAVHAFSHCALRVSWRHWWEGVQHGRLHSSQQLARHRLQAATSHAKAPLPSACASLWRALLILGLGLPCSPSPS